MRVNSKEEGAVLLTTLLVMALMAAVAVALIDDIRFAVKRAGNVQSYAQLDWYEKAAEEFAAVYLEQQLVNQSVSTQNDILLSAQPAVLPFDGGQMILSIRDGSQCVSLGALSEAAGRGQFRELLTLIGWSELDAARLTAVAIDWQDEDLTTLPNGAEDYPYLGQKPAYRTANTAFTDLTELRLLDGMTEELYQQLRPFVCVRDKDLSSQININTLTLANVQVLASVIGGEDALGLAGDIITQRPDGGYADQEALLGSPAFEGVDTGSINFDLISYQPNFIWIEGRIEYQQAYRFVAFEFSVENGQVTPIYRGHGEDVLRPVLESNVL